MSTLIALNVAVLPPEDVARQAIALSAALPAGESKGLQLGSGALPHITLTQLFVRSEELEPAFDRIAEVLRDRHPIPVRLTGAQSSGGTVTLTVEMAAALADLHHRLMDTLRGLERPEGTPAAFFGGDARLADVLWVTSYRLKSAFGAYQPHITLGHASEAPHVKPMTFDARTVAACHLGRYCTCAEVLRRWTLG